MLFAILAAIPGRRSGQANAAADWARVLAFSASACAAITPVLGQGYVGSWPRGWLDPRSGDR